MKTDFKEIGKTKSDVAFDIVNAVIMAVTSLLIAYPLYYVFVASFTEPHIVSQGKVLLYPVEFFIDGYKRIFNYPPIWTGYLNTIKYTFVGTLVSLLVTIPCGYALSRKDLFLRRQIMVIFTFTMFFSGGLIPLYLVIKKVQIYDTIWALVLPGGLSVYNLIVCRTFFDSSLPDELLEASKIDGCSDYGFFFKIVIPLSSTIIAVMVLFYSTVLWNSFMPALMFMSDIKKMPLQVVLRNLILINEAVDITTSGSEMAMRQKLAEQLKYGVIVVSIVPLLSLYPFVQKYFAKGVMIGSVKG